MKYICPLFFWIFPDVPDWPLSKKHAPPRTNGRTSPNTVSSTWPSRRGSTHCTGGVGWHAGFRSSNDSLVLQISLSETRSGFVLIKVKRRSNPAKARSCTRRSRPWERRSQTSHHHSARFRPERHRTPFVSCCHHRLPFLWPWGQR